MPVDVALFRSYGWGDPRVVRESQRRRRADPQLVDDVIALDGEWRALSTAVDEANRALNQFSRRYKSGAAADEEDRERMRALKASTKVLQADALRKQAELHESLARVGNIVHQDAPHGADLAAAAAPPSSPAAADPAPAEGAVDHGARDGERASAERRAALLERLCATLHAAGFEIATGAAPEPHTPEPASGFRDASDASGPLERCTRALADGVYHVATSRSTGAAVPHLEPLSTHSLPSKRAFVRRTDGARARVDCAVVVAGDTSSSWRELESLKELALACARAAGLADARAREVPAHLLPIEAARAYDVCPARAREGEGARTVVVARCVNHVDFVARARGWRQMLTRLRDQRTPEARFVHTLLLSFDFNVAKSFTL
ncbi:hypothetical protein KFE25_000698 [Diacronema lutheri]|uniref:Serine-tRNA synthetase type1 N-terminal domain-containing protein n=1 Tax=Diacronema lutheri TaxID=2081491 RepID=A0A8J5XRZ3_DIALT|nr:hypothetical protein KFE25_000698 [Diacronema lutheri]